MGDQEWRVYEWRLRPSTAQLRTVDLLVRLLVGVAIVVTLVAALSSASLRLYVVPAALAAVAAVIWQQRAWSMAFRLAVNARAELVVDDGRGHRDFIPLPGAEVALLRRRRRGLGLGPSWRWAIEVRTADGHEIVHGLPAFTGWVNPTEAEACAVVTALTEMTGAPPGRIEVEQPIPPAVARPGRDRTRFEWRHPRLAEIARLRRRIRMAFGVGLAAAAAATAIALWGDELSALSPAVCIGVGIVLLVAAALVDWLFRQPFRWVLQVDGDGMLRVSSGTRRRDVRLTGASDVVVGRRRHEVADGELGTAGSGWAVAVRRPDGDLFEAAIPSVGGWAQLEPDDAVALERVLRRRAGLPVEPGR